MITLPQATYITIDPCYVMRDDAYDILCDKMDFNTRAQIVEIEGHQMALSNTAWGDGCYDSNLGVSFSVDAGIIGAVPLELCCPEKLKEDFVKQNSFMMNDTSIAFSYDNGTFKFNELEIYTNYEEEEFDEDEDEDDNCSIW